MADPTDDEVWAVILPLAKQLKTGIEREMPEGESLPAMLYSIQGIAEQFEREGKKYAEWAAATEDFFDLAETSKRAQEMTALALTLAAAAVALVYMHPLSLGLPELNVAAVVAESTGKPN